MVERHRRAQARAMLSKAGYKSGGHFKSDGAPVKRLIGEAIREHEEHDHPGKKRTPLKLADGGAVKGFNTGMRIHKPRGMAKGKKPHTTVNVLVGGPHPVQNQPVPVPIGGPPPIGPGAMGPPGGLPGQPPMGANRGGRFKKGGTVKADSQRDPIKGLPEGKLKNGGKAQKRAMGGPIMAPSASVGNTVMGLTPNGPATQGGGGNSVMGVTPPMPGGRPPMMVPNPNDIMKIGGNGGLPMNRGGKAKTKKVIDDGAGGGLGRLEKAKAYGAKVKRGGHTHV